MQFNFILHQTKTGKVCNDTILTWHSKKKNIFGVQITKYNSDALTLQEQLFRSLLTLFLLMAKDKV